MACAIPSLRVGEAIAGVAEAVLGSAKPGA